jgi:hypothetical protein
MYPMFPGQPVTEYARASSLRTYGGGVTIMMLKRPIDVRREVEPLEVPRMPIPARLREDRSERASDCLDHIYLD